MTPRPIWKINRDKARKLSVVEGFSARAISELLGVPMGYVVRWQREGQWEAARRRYAGRARLTARVAMRIKAAQERTLGKLLRAVQYMKAETPEQVEALARAVHLLADVRSDDAIIQEQLDAALSGLLKARKGR